MRSLYTKLAFTLVVLILLLGGAFYILEKRNAEQYYEELSQRLNASIAMYVVDTLPLIENSRVNNSNLQSLAQQAMVVNPTAEIYVLDPDGTIIAHTHQPEDIITDKVDIHSVKALISGQTKLPIRATDPKHLHKKKIFSAHPIMENETLAGYLYVVLGGSQYDILASEVRKGYWQTMMPVAIIIISLIALIFGLISFRLITSRLQALANKVQNLSENKFRLSDESRYVALDALNDLPDKPDEIDLLSAAYSSMALKLNEQFSELEENDRLRRELITNISHDLRTPLASMQGYIDTLIIKNESLSAADRVKYLDIARKHTRHLNRLIADLFELAKLDSGRLIPNKEPFSLLELLHDVLQEFAQEAEKRGIRIDLDISHSNPQVYADIGLIQRVLENLIKNALRFTPAGGHITLGLTDKSEHVSVIVADNGHGIDSQDLPHIFDRYFYSKTNNTRPAESSGLGLAIVKRILDLHESSIQVSSKLKEGTKFIFDLPRKQVA